MPIYEYFIVYKSLTKGMSKMRLDLDYTSPSTQFTFDLNKNTAFKKDNNNFINQLSVKDLNTLDNLSLLDIYLSTNNVVEPHYHQNSSELVYCIAGSAIVSIINPYTKQLLNYPINPGQVANVPQGWWHYDRHQQNQYNVNSYQNHTFNYYPYQSQNYFQSRYW